LGFNPLEESKENDFQLVAGLKGSIGDWTWDLAEAYGEDHMDVYTIDSANATLYADTGSTPTNFYDGKFISTQSTTTIDITKDFDLGMAGPLTVAFGGEHRRETWVLGPGEPSSYIGGGAQSFPGYSATVATNASRHSDAGYIDLAATPITGLKWMSPGATRTIRTSAAPPWANSRPAMTSIRRSPCVAPSAPASARLPWPRSTTPTSTWAPPPPSCSSRRTDRAPACWDWGRAEARTLHEPQLRHRTAPAGQPSPQRSMSTRSWSRPHRRQRQHQWPKQRRTLRGRENVTAAIAASGLSIDPAVLATGTTGINLFANGVDTRTRGIDFTLSSPEGTPLRPCRLDGGRDVQLHGSHPCTLRHPEMGGQPLFDAQAISALTTQSPRVTLNLGAHYTVSQYYVDLHEIIYGKSSSCDNPDSDTSQHPLATPCAIVRWGLYYYENHIGTVAITNLELGVNLKESLTVAIGANNLFNRYPNQVNAANTAVEAQNFDNAAVQKYSPFSPFGIDGGFYYARLGYKF
jgi:iron complex outermembrane receptor protein